MFNNLCDKITILPPQRTATPNVAFIAVALCNYSILSKYPITFFPVPNKRDIHIRKIKQKTKCMFTENPVKNTYISFCKCLEIAAI